MSKQLNFAQQMDEVLKTLGPQQAWSRSFGRAGANVFNTSSICCAKFNCFDMGFILWYTGLNLSVTQRGA